jgi:hypothetical protein
MSSQLKYYYRHREEILGKLAQYYKINRERIRECNHMYYITHKGKAVYERKEKELERKVKEREEKVKEREEKVKQYHNPQYKPMFDFE